MVVKLTLYSIRGALSKITTPGPPRVLKFPPNISRISLPGYKAEYEPIVTSVYANAPPVFTGSVKSGVMMGEAKDSPAVEIIKAEMIASGRTVIIVTYEFYLTFICGVHYFGGFLILEYWNVGSTLNQIGVLSSLSVPPLWLTSAPILCSCSPGRNTDHPRCLATGKRVLLSMLHESPAHPARHGLFVAGRSTAWRNFLVLEPVRLDAQHTLVSRVPIAADGVGDRLCSPGRVSMAVTMSPF